MAAAEPTVSVVIMAGNRRERAARALASVLDQEGIERAEVVLVEACNDGSPPLPRSDHPAVRIVHRPQRGASGFLRGEGARHARAPIVAYLEEHAVALEGWLVAVEAALASGEYAATSGEVHTLNPGAGISDAVAAMNYAPWLPPLERRRVSRIILGHDAAYRREELLAFGEQLDAFLSAEVVLQWRLSDAGRPLLIDPAIRIAHQNETTMASICKGYYLWNVSFGAWWSATEGWSRSRRALQALGVPWWVGRRLLGMVRACEQPAGRRALLRHLPTVVVSQTAAAAGIAVGAIRGDQGHAHRFADYELDQDRGEAAAASSR